MSLKLFDENILCIQVAELKMNWEQEKAQMLRDFHMEKEMLHADKERDVEHIRETLKLEISDTERRAKDKSDADAKVNSGLVLYLQSYSEHCIHLHNRSYRQKTAHIKIANFCPRDSRPMDLLPIDRYSHML